MAGFYVDRGLTSTRLFEDRITGNQGSAYATTGETVIVPQSPDTPIPVVTPPSTTTATVLNVQTNVPGFGSYLNGILPPDIATACGAFSASMQQIKNISSIPVEKFAQVVTSLETTKGLNVNGTNVPTDTTLAQQGLNIIALGNGPFGTYTMSNFLGCMSGLPYIGINIRQYIQELETPTLLDIYKNLYLAVTWERATVSVQYTTYTGPAPDYDTYYHVTGLTITDAGGGYGREGASAPTITISNGGSGTTTIGTDYTNIGASGSYGRVTSVSLSSSGSDSTSVPTATVAYPPGGTSFSNSIVQGYIDAANAEILVIKNSQPAKAQQLITNWEKTGTLLSIEQRAIATGLPIKVPLVTPADDREPTLAGYPTTQYSFVDSIPQYAAATQPHMYSQTLEAISNLNTLGGRSLVAMLRQARNQDRLTKLGIPLDNNIEDTLTNKQQAQLIGNGVLPKSVPGTNGITPTGEFVDTTPATLVVLDPGATVSSPVPYPASTASNTNSPNTYGYYNPVDNNYYNTNILFGTTSKDGGSGSGEGTPIDTGQANEPGSFAGSRYRNLISPELSAIYTSDVLLPATYSIQEAIDEVIRCNCDCWDNI